MYPMIDATGKSLLFPKYNETVTKVSIESIINRSKDARLEPASIPAAALFCVRHATIPYDLCTANHISTQVGFRGERTGIVSDELRFPRRFVRYQENLVWMGHCSLSLASGGLW